MAHVLPFPRFRAFDTNGNPLAGGKLYSYAAGTSTPLNTYTSKTEGATNANPTILDSNGEADVWLGASAYKFVLKTSADVTLWTVDNVTFLNNDSLTLDKIPDGMFTANAAGLAKFANGFLTADTAGRAKMADGFVTASQLGASAVETAKINNLAVTTGKLAANVLSADATGLGKMADGFLSADATGRAKMADGFVNAAKLASDAVTTVKILDSQVTPAKRSAAVVGSATPIGAYTTTSSSYANTGLAVTSFTYTRPITIYVFPFGDGAINGGTGGMKIAIDRGGVNIHEITLGAGVQPAFGFSFPYESTGTYTFTIVVKSLDGSSITFSNWGMKIIEH
jgi:hypothetical protein